MSKDFAYLRWWLTGEGYREGFEPRDVILECIRSRSGMSMAVYDRGKRIFTVNGCGFDRLGTAAGIFLETLFQPELIALAIRERRCTDEPYGNCGWYSLKSRYGLTYTPESLTGSKVQVYLDGACSLSSMQAIAQAIGLRLEQAESKAGTLLIFKKAR